MTIADENAADETLARARDSLRADLARLRRRLRIQLALELTAEVAAVAVAVAAALVTLDRAARLGLASRATLLAAAVAGVAGFAASRAARRWRTARLDDVSLAMTLDQHRPGLGQRLADVLQLPGLIGADDASPAMVREAVRKAADGLAASGWTRMWNPGRTIAFAALGLLASTVPAAFAVIDPHAARLSVDRWLRGSDERWPQETYLTVMNLDARGRFVAPRDERALVEVRSDLPLIEPAGGLWSVGGRGAPLALRKRPASPARPELVTLRERTAKGVARSAPMAEAAPGRFQYEIPPSAEPSSFELVGGDDWLGPILVERVDRPSLARMEIRVKDPGTANPDFREVAASERLLFLPDSEIILALIGSQDVSEVKLTVNPGPAPPATRTGPRAFESRWTLREPVTLEVVLTSSETGLASKPSFLSIGVLRDREPRVTLRSTGVGGRVTPVATIPLTIAATDDLGLASLRIQADRSPPAADSAGPERQAKRTAVAIPLEVDPSRPALDHQARHDVSLQADPPAVGTILRFTGEAEDRCARGAQTGRSGALAFSVVSPDELFYEILTRQRAERSKFLALVEAAEKRTPVLVGAPRPEDLVAAARAEQASARQVGQIAGRIADAVQEMRLNQIGSAKSHRLLQEGVVDPLRALASGPMPKLQAALQSLAAAPDRGGAAGDDARRRHEEVVTTMRRILEQMSQWESFVDVVNQVAEVIKMEQKVLHETEKARDARAQEVFDDKP